MTKSKNRWLIALSAIGIQLSIGSIYAYSILKKPIHDLLDWDLGKVSNSFSIAILVLGLSAAFLGKKIEKMGPRLSGTLAGIFYGVGIIGAGVALKLQSLSLFYLFYGVVGGIGLGIGYLAPLSTVIAWFPDKKGLATGMCIMGFGFGSLVFGPLMAKLIQSSGVDNTLCLLGGVYMTIMILSSQYLAKPKEGWAEQFFKDAKKKAGDVVATITSPMSLKEVFTSKKFYLLWTIFFINITCGISIISIASPFAQEAVGMTALQASFMVGIMGLFNGLGRLGWSALSDKLGRLNTYMTFFILELALFAVLPSLTQVVLFQLVIFAIISCYGGGFAIMPAFISDLFGNKHLSIVQGWMLTAWSTAGVFGPKLLDAVLNKTGSYSTALYFYSGLFTLAIVLAMVMNLDIKKSK